MGLLSSLVGLLFIYSPILLFYFDINDVFLWILSIILGSIILTINILSDYYLIGIQEIVHFVNYLINLIKQVPEILQKSIYSVFKHIYLIIPLLDVILIAYLGLNGNTLFIIVISSVIFIAGLIRVLLKNVTEFENRIRNRSNQAVLRVSNVKLKFDSNIIRYCCISLRNTLKLHKHLAPIVTKR